MPFPVRGIQVDGGSEFMAAFEQACADNDLALFVLPPKRPQLNGGVERAQGSWRYEFYASLRPAKAGSTASTPSSKPSHTSTTTTDPTGPLADEPPPTTSISPQPNETRNRLTCAEPGHRLDTPFGSDQDGC